MRKLLTLLLTTLTVLPLSADVLKGKVTDQKG